MTDWITSGSWNLGEPEKQRLEAIAGVVRGPRILDMGTRDGTLALTLARDHPDYEIIGADIDAKQIEYANLKAIQLGLDNATFFCVSIFDSFGPTTLGTFDCVICAETLEHLPPTRVQEANDNLIHYCKKDGRLIVTVPANTHISDPDHSVVFYREMFHGQVTWIPEMPFLWLGWYKDFGGHDKPEG